MDRFFNGYKLRYEQMNEYLLPVRASRKITSINIFINLDDLYHKMHRPITSAEFQTTGENAPRQLVSNLINLIGHYKNWAIKEHLQPNIYLVYTTATVFKNALRVPGYRGYFNKINDPKNIDFYFINSAINSGYSILNTVTKYIPHAYAIDSKYLEPSIIPLYLSTVNPASYNLLVSRDPYDLQYANFDNWGIISPKGDNSSFIVRGTLWEYLTRKHSIDYKVYFHPSIYTLALGILGDKYRSIPKLTRTGWKTIIKYLEETSNPIDDANANYDYYLSLQEQRLSQYISSKKIDDYDFNHNMYVTSIKSQVGAMLDSDKIIIDQQLTDMQDPISLKTLNNTVFQGHQLNLAFLLRDAPSSDYEPHDDYIWRKVGHQ